MNGKADGEGKEARRHVRTILNTQGSVSLGKLLTLCGPPLRTVSQKAESLPKYWVSGWVKVIQSCLILRNPMDYTVYRILQARILEWVAFPFSRGSSQPRDRAQASHIAGGFFTSWATREAQNRNMIVIFKLDICVYEVKVKVAQSHLTLCDSMGYTVHGILQARILDWVTFPFSRGSSQPRDQTQVSRIAGRFFTSWATREAQLNTGFHYKQKI